MSSQEDFARDDRQSWPSRTASCQLPLLHPGHGRSLHRMTQSFEMDTHQAPGSGLPPKSMSREEYQGAKGEKDKCRAAASHTTVLLVTLLAFLVPAAFVLGHATGVAAGGGCVRLQKPGLSIGRMAFSGGTGRQLSHDDSSNGTVLLPHGAGHGGAGWARGAAGLPDSQALARPDPEAAALSSELPASDMLFVTWIAFGDFGDGGFHTHNFHKVDMRWAEVARRSHPGCKIGLILDQDTQLEESAAQMVDFLHRVDIDKKVYGRNEYNDFYHWTARYSMLEKLVDEGQDSHNVVFLDPDVFVLDDLQEVFHQGNFDYATTISENPVQPVNGAMHFVRAHRYPQAVEILKGVLSSFQLKPEMGFTAGQQAYSDYFELTLEEQLVKRMQSEAILQGMGCNPIQGGAYNICFVICTRYNFWEDCSEIPAVRVTADNAEDYAAQSVKVFHFIAYRKLGMQRVYDAFMAEGLEAAYSAWAELPHTEDGYKADPSFGKEA